MSITTDGVYGLPDFLTSEQWRGYYSISQINKMVRIGDVTVGGYIGRRERLGKTPIPYTLYEGRKKYRPIDFVPFARAEGLEIASPAKKKKLEYLASMADEIKAIDQQIGKLENQLAEKRSKLKALRGYDFLVGERIHSTQEIAEASCPFEKI